MKGTIAVLPLIIALIFLPAVLSVNTAQAQSTSYTVQSVTHTVEVMFSGYTVIRDDVKVSGSLTNGFQIGLPSKYADAVLEVVAYSGSEVYTVEKNVQLGGQSGFYGVQVNFGGSNPASFSVEFVLSNNLLGENTGLFALDYPAYPALTTSAAECSVDVSLPAEPTGLTITKSDGNTNSTSYSKSNLAAFTSIPAVASFQLPVGLLQLIDITSLNRNVNINVDGAISAVDSYSIRNMDVYSLTSFLLSLPTDATNVVVRDEAGGVLTSNVLGTAGSTLLVNATLPSPIRAGQSVRLVADYKLPSNAGSNYNLTLFPALNYYVDQATYTLTVPEGAQISTPDTFASVATNGYQQTLTVNRKGVSYVDYTVPGYDFVQVNYSYNPLWASFRPTIVAFALSAIGCIGIAFWRNIKPKMTTAKPHVEKPAAPAVAEEKHAAQAKTEAQAPKAALRTSPELVHRFIDAYDDRKELLNEERALDLKAQKGKIPRSQYKIQRRALEVRVESLNRNINESKQVFLNASPAFADLIRQLESQEEELSEVNDYLDDLETQRNSGEVTLEEYKEAIVPAKEEQKKIENVINGILLRLREKMH